ncbi:MAG TPA: ankyrin repeat domain-containing protein [Firmicutes bacterium]|nr:ankyrin repeat domain-containing protein [Bacillota bacterium]
MIKRRIDQAFRMRRKTYKRPARRMHEIEEIKLNFLDRKLYEAVFENSKSSVECLIKAGANADCDGPCGYSFLNIAIRREYIKIADILIKAGADINRKDAGGVYPIQQAMSLSKQDFINLLIKRGVDVNISFRDVIIFDPAKIGRSGKCIARTCTPLILAAESGGIMLVKKLLSAGAQVNAKDSSGFTALARTVLMISPENIGKEKEGFDYEYDSSGSAIAVIEWKKYVYAPKVKERYLKIVSCLVKSGARLKTEGGKRIIKMTSDMDVKNILKKESKELKTKGRKKKNGKFCGQETVGANYEERPQSGERDPEVRSGCKL